MNWFVYVVVLLSSTWIQQLAGFILNNLPGYQTKAPEKQDVDCTQIHSYNVLMTLARSGDCLSANSVWHYLDNIEKASKECRKRVVYTLAQTYRNPNPLCICQPTGKLIDERAPHVDGLHFQQCNDRQPYGEIHDELFSHITHFGCQDHSALWSKLDDVVDVAIGRNHTTNLLIKTDCTKDLIIRADIRYPNLHSDTCTCSGTTTTSTTTTTTSTTTTTTTTPAPTTTTPMPTTTIGIHDYHCGESRVVVDMATDIAVHSILAQPCQLTGYDESLLISECLMPVSSAWRRGINVLADCQDGSAVIPQYVPIAMFNSNNYVSSGGFSAVFLGCTDTGFLAVIQRCGSSPEVIDMSTDLNIASYYTVV